MSDLGDFEIHGGKVTVDQAAWMTGKSNQAIYNAIKDGRLTADAEDRDGKTVKVIQLVDIERLYQNLKYPGMEESAPSPSYNKSKSSAVEADYIVEKIEKRFEDQLDQYKQQLAQYKEEVEHMRQKEDKMMETVNRVTLMLEDKSNNKEEVDEWKKSIQALESRIANQETKAKEEEERAQKILRQNQALKKQLEEEKNKSFWAKLFG